MWQWVGCTADAHKYNLIIFGVGLGVGTGTGIRRRLT